MEKYKIKTATACYTGGGIYIYYGQLENGLYFRAWDDFDTVCICDTNTGTEDAEYIEFYAQHTIEELTGETFKAFWNKMLLHFINDGAPFDEWNNYQKSDLKRRIMI